MQNAFEQFIKERQYLTNVSPATIEWYRQSLAWLGTESPTDADLKSFVMRMREKGLKPSGCNCRIRAVNAFLKWSGSMHRVTKLKEPQLILPTFTADHIKRFLGHKPKGYYQRSLHLLVLMLLDTGCRISEALDLRVADCDLDNLLMTVKGKGQKERKVPFSLELRKALFRYTREMQPHQLVLSTKQGCRLDRHIVSRDMKRFCRRLGFAPPVRTLHAFRHTFAVTGKSRFLIWKPGLGQSD